MSVTRRFFISDLYHNSTSILEFSEGVPIHFNQMNLIPSIANNISAWAEDASIGDMYTYPTGCVIKLRPLPNKGFTYRHLLNSLLVLESNGDERIDSNVTIWMKGEDEYYPVESLGETSDDQSVLDEDHPILVVPS